MVRCQCAAESRLGADGRRKHENLGTHERHRARGLGKPLIPADRDAELRKLGIEYLESRVARREVILLVVARALRDVRFAVAAEHLAAGIHDHHGIIEGIVRLLEHAHRQHHVELARKRTEVLDGRMALERLGEIEIAGGVILAKIGRLEQLLNQHDVCAARSRLANQLLGARHVGLALPTARHLRRRHCHFSHFRMLPGIG
jgi:hypothetical protein